jgi:hypothetical protein
MISFIVPGGTQSHIELFGRRVLAVHFDELTNAGILPVKDNFFDGNEL